MAEFPVLHNPTTAAIYEAYAKSRAQAWDAMGISISLLGEECERALWYAFRWASKPEVIDGLKAITFETGEIEETRLLNALRMIGCEVDEVDSRGKQYRASAIAGHVRGKMDGKVLGLPEAPKTWHIVECKSMKDTYWDKVKKHGVREGYFSHWVQLNTYCHLFGFERGLYICRNKNTGEVYSERIHTDHVEAIRLLERAERIVNYANPPMKLHNDPKAKAAFKCRTMCSHKAICHDGEFARVSCRSCLHATPEHFGDAAWSCARWGKPLTLAEQKAGCPAHLFIPTLVPGEVIDSSEKEEWILYTLRDGREWRDGSKPTTRYWHHPESCSVFTTQSDEADPREGGGADAVLVEEITAEQFEQLSKHYTTGEVHDDVY
ncbi:MULTISPECIES: hypothetical protein [unclassified Bradyrhizobium]|uniref:hypothetical protein n=1 Tax=unclassified Bradyrhizobium TaxID=2631580 RepID=UPI0028E85C12|nr:MULTISPECIES: hypothetical protein [unclassified Bradyrhizobium]